MYHFGSLTGLELGQEVFEVFLRGLFVAFQSENLCNTVFVIHTAGYLLINS